MAFHPRDPSRSDAAGQGGPAEGQQERVARALARAGVSSRRDAERLIEAGRVAVNGEVLTHPAVNVGPGDILTLDGQVVAEPEPIRIWRHHKPAGLLTAHKDPKGRKTVFEALPKEMGRVISVGRLDLSSEGLLLLTNDGELTRALELPSSGWLRRYRARAYGRVDQAKLDRLKDGVTIEGVHYGAIEASLEKSGGGSNVWVNVAVREGKNREVRRVLEHLGLKVNRLIRTAYGPFELGDLETGAVAELSPRIIREALRDVIPSERLPKGDRKLFNWSPSRAAPRRRDEAGDHVPAELRRAATSSSRPTRGRAGAAERGPQTLTTGKPSRAKPEQAKPEYKAGWARPKPKAPRGPAKGKAASGPKRPPSRPKGRG